MVSDHIWPAKHKYSTENPVKTCLGGWIALLIIIILGAMRAIFAAGKNLFTITF